MKLQNNQTGQVENFCIDKDQICSCDRAFVYNSLAQLQEAGWEDYEEQCFYITSTGEVREGDLDADWRDERRIGNYFETEEEAEKAVEKLKAWKRLKQGGFHWNSWTLGGAHFGVDLYDGYNNDLDLVFGGEE